MKRSSILRFLRIATTTTLLIYVFHGAGLLTSAGWQDLFNTFTHTQVPFVLASLSMGVFLNFSSSVKWYFLARARGLSVSLWRLCFYYIIGKFFNLILPSSIGGDVIRIHELGRYTGRYADAAAVVFVERFSGLVTLLVMALIAVVVNLQVFNLPWLTISLAAGVFALGMICWLIVSDFPLKLLRWLIGEKIALFQKFLTKIAKFRQAVLAYQHNSNALWWAFFNSLIFYFLAIINVWFSTLSFDDSVKFLSVLIATPVIMFIMNLPISIGGIGLLEFAFTFTLGLFGVSPSVAISTALFMRIKTLIEAGIGGALYYLISERHVSPKTLSEMAAKTPQE